MYINVQGEVAKQHAHGHLHLLSSHSNTIIEGFGKMRTVVCKCFNSCFEFSQTFSKINVSYL